MQLYLLTNIKNGKCYVGMTANTAAGRFRGHCISAERGSATALHASIRKYGPDSFRCEVLAEPTSREELQRLEIEHIARLGTMAPGGYNLTVGGDGFSGRHKAESLEKMRISQLERYSRETPERLAEIGKKISAGLERRGEYSRGDGGKKNKGRVRSEEFKEKVSGGVKKMISELPDGEMSRRAKLPREFKGRNTTPEQKERMRENARLGALRRYSDPEQRRLAAERTRAQHAKKREIILPPEGWYAAQPEEGAGRGGEDLVQGGTGMTSNKTDEHLLLKWGSLKGWGGLSKRSVAVCEEYGDLRISTSAAAQVMTPRHKEWLCKLIDSVAEGGGTIQSDWTGEMLTADEAKKYVTEYAA